MENLVCNLGAYNILNSIFPGAIMYYLAVYLLKFNLNIKFTVLGEICLYYMIGVVIGRFASIIVKPVSEKIRLVKYAEYQDFLYARSKDGKVGILSETNDNYRNIFSVFIIVDTFKVFRDYDVSIPIKNWSVDAWLLFGVTLLFALAYRKQTKFVKDSVDFICKDYRS